MSEDPHLAQAMSLLENRQYPEAFHLLRLVQDTRPDDIPVLNALAFAASRCGQHARAIQAAARLTELLPAEIGVLRNYCLILAEAEKWKECESNASNFLKKFPHDPDLLEHLGVALLNLKKGPEAVDALKAAYRAETPNAQGWYRLGSAFLVAHDLDKAEKSLALALQMQPDYPEALVNLALVHRCREDIPQGIDCLEKALALRPDYASAHFNRATLLLISGKWKEGWEEFEWRRKLFASIPPGISEWKGESFAGKTLLISREQGMGDLILLSRFFPQVKALGGRIIVECHPPLAELISKVPGVDAVLTPEQPRPSVDLAVPVFSLPGIFQTTLGNIPQHPTFATASPSEDFEVGLAWAGNPLHDDDRFRSCPEEIFLKLLEIKTARFHSLQHGGTHPLAEQSIREGGLQNFLADHPSLEELTARIGKLRLVITIDSMMAHLAASCGVPTWLLIARPCDWRWQLAGDITPWYPAIRIFRQPQPNDWAGLIGKVSLAIQQEIDIFHSK